MSSARPPPTTVTKNAQKSAMSMYLRNMRDGYRVAAFERKLPCGKGRWRSALLLRPHPVRHGAGNPRAEYQDHDHQTGDNAWCARLERVPSMYIPTVESTVKSAIMVTHQIREALRSRDMGASSRVTPVRERIYLHQCQRSTTSLREGIGLEAAQ